MDTKTKDEKKKKKNSIMYRTNICDIRTNPTHHHHNNNNNQNPTTTTTTTGSTKETLSSPTTTTMTTTTMQQHSRRCCHHVPSLSTILSHPLALPLTAILHPNTVVPLDYQVYPSALLYKVLYEDFSEDDDHDVTHHHHHIDDTTNYDGPTRLEPPMASKSSSLPTWTTTPLQLDDVLESTMTGPFGCCTHTIQNHPMWTNTLIQRLKQYLTHVHHPLMVQLPSSPPPNGHPTPPTHHHHPKNMKNVTTTTNQEHQCPFHIILVDPTSPAVTVMRNKTQPPLASVVTAIQISTTTTTSSMENASLNSRQHDDHRHWSKTFKTGTAFLDKTTTTNHSSPLSSSNQQQQHVHYCYRKPMIFVNITIDTTSYPQNTNTKETTSSTTVRIGCFLCTRPKMKASKAVSSESYGCNTNNIHTILLWRDEYTFLDDKQSDENSDSNAKTIKCMSKSFGNIIRASTLCYYCRDMAPYIQCKYLSPNCSLYDKNMVLRCYDSRMYQHENERRSDVYLQQRHANDSNSCIFPMESCADVVLSLLDSNYHIDGATGTSDKRKNLLDDSLQSDSRETTTTEICPMDWLWQFQGKLIVIATPYRPGYHYAQRPTDFIPIIEHLQYLHNDHDIVHGDIRASNMVFSTKNCRRHKLEQAPASPFTGLNGQVNNQIVTKRKAKKSAKKEVLSKMACTVITTIKSSAMTTIKDVLSTRSPLMRPMSSIEIPIHQTAFTNGNKNIFDTRQGCLIDFDFGGLSGASNTRYPTGYNRFVYDGYRIGQEHQMIQYKDDWYALIMVIFQVHVFTPPSIIIEHDTDSPFYKDLHQSVLKQVENTVLRFCSIKRDEHGSNEIEKVQAKDIAKLKRLLIDMEAFGYTVSQRLA